VYLLQIVLQHEVQFQAFAVPDGTLERHRVQRDALWILVQLRRVDTFELAPRVLEIPHLDLLVVGERGQQRLARAELDVHQTGFVYSLGEETLEGVPQGRVDDIHDPIVEQVDFQLRFRKWYLRY
jgi:hypothetical protein